jgi:pimeloyl-ACP methyl ester carboxylesterase
MTLETKNRMVETEFLQTNLMEEIPTVKIPVCFMLGRHDLNCPSEISANYWEQLKAPVKKLIWFEESAHSSCFEEPESFIKETQKFFLSSL